MTDVKVLFASGSDEVIAQTLREFKSIFPEVRLVVVSEFPPRFEELTRTTEPGSAKPLRVPDDLEGRAGPVRAEGEWIRYYIRRSFWENRALIQSRLRGRSIRVAAIILEPKTPHWPMRLLGMTLAPWRLLAYSETGQHFRIRPDNLLVMLRHLLWRSRNLVRSQVREGGWLHDTLELLGDAGKLRMLALCLAARLRPWFSRPPSMLEPWPVRERPSGLSVVIPSRDGRLLLESCLPLIEGADEIVVIDNGSDDGTEEFLRQNFPQVGVEEIPQPLSFADAANRGIRRSRFSHVCLLNNDMLVEPGFLANLRKAFDRVPGLFSASAQIFFPEGQRREETGKTVWAGARAAVDFPVRCDIPLDGEDLSYVLYGSGGCTLYDAAKLAAMGGFDPVYYPAYVEDLDIGVRAWRRGWPSVYCATARVLHRHRSTTSRYFTPRQLDAILEANFVRFLARFGWVWRENLQRLRMQGKIEALQIAARIPVAGADGAEAPYLPLVSGDVAVFPGRPRSGLPVVMIASPYLPFPLSHGAAVRMYNLMLRTASGFDLVLVSFVEEPASVPAQLAEICVEIVTVRRPGSHALPSTARPDIVEEFDSPAFHAALRQTAAKWRPRIVQLEFTQMAQYAADCKPARTILVEHDITYDLYEQMLRVQKESVDEDWEVRRQYERWLRFETEAWRGVDRVVTMSEKDRKVVAGSVAIPNGVDLDRFRPSLIESKPREPEPRRLLFIGSFAHPPNVLALEFFLRDVLPRLAGVTLHVIAGQRHERFWDLHHDNVEVEGFVADVRPAYERASVVIAPLIASAGTNIKVLEAMAMGKAIVSTEAGINGLDLERGADVIVADPPEDMARAINRLLDSPEERQTLQRHARRTAEERYGWDAIAAEQERLYLSLV